LKRLRYLLVNRRGMADEKPPNLRFLSSDTNGWQDHIEEEGAHLASAFSRILTSRHLLVLSGLGTSRCIESSPGESAAPTMADLWAAVTAADPTGFEEAKKRVSWNEESENVELLLSRCQMEQELRPNQKLQDFIKAGEKAIAASCDFVKEGTDLDTHELLLRKIARRQTKLPRAQIFTTNYDLAFEAAAARIGFAVIDGFTASTPPRFDPVAFDRDQARRDASDPSNPIDWVPNVLQLHKLHGSIDWAVVGGSIQRVPDTTTPVIVYPRASKFEVSYQQPFLELMSRFQSALRRPGTGLIVAGCGFEDRHVAEPFLAAVRSNVGLNVLVVSRSLENSKGNVPRFLKKLIGKGDRRLGLVAGSFKGMVQALPDLVATTEEEAHAQRFSAAHDG
jgi:SIR2-like protein